MDLLLKEVQKAGEAGKTLEEVLDKLRVIWTADNREAVLTQLENHLEGRHSRRFPDDSQQLVAEALQHLMQVADDQPSGNRHRADLTVSRIIKYLDPPLELETLAPWFRDKRPFRANTVKRALRRTDDLSSVSDVLVYYFRERPDADMMRLIARTPGAAAQIFPEELDTYFEAYVERFKSREWDPDKSAKYFAMMAARVLIIGEQPIPPELFQSMPEIFSWAIEHIGDPAYESMLIWLIGEHPDNPEVLWSAIRTSGKRFMTKAQEKALDAASQLLFIEEGVMIWPPELIKPGN